MKVVIVGYSGSGKSTLAKKLGKKYKIPVLYMDKVFFESGWVERDKEEAKNMVLDFMKQDSWVIDGNYSLFYQKERFQQADKIIYMKFNRFACLYRVFLRYKKYKNHSRESMAEGCNEKLDWEFIRWILIDGRKRSTRKKFNRMVEQYKDKTDIIRNQRELDQFLSK